MLCYCVRKSKHRVNRDNTLLYSARFNLVRPSHADSKNVTQMEQKLSTTYTVCSFFKELQYDEFKTKHRPEWGSDHMLISFSAPLLLHFTSVFVVTSSKCQTNLKELAFL